jgi:hypothetical protein
MKPYDYDRRKERQMTPNEDLAAYAHEAWSGWMKYLLSKCKTGPDGSFIIPEEFAQRWMRQMGTPYKDLPEGEKKSDREEAVKMQKIFLKEDTSE